MRRVPFTCTAALVAGLYSISVCTAQVSDHATAVPQNPPSEIADPLDAPAPSTEVNLNLIDQKLALSLAVDTRAQIDIADLALKTIASDPLRRYVTERLESQRAFAARLDALTEGRTREALARALREIENDKAEKSPDAKFRLLSIRNATAMLARIRLEILQEYAQLLYAERASKSAEEFDRHYLRSDLLNQMQMLATLKVFEGQASDDFGRVIREAQSTASAQLDRGRQLLMQLETAPLAGAPAVKPALAETIVTPQPPAQNP
jgi:hypothetical protein